MKALRIASLALFGLVAVACGGSTLSVGSDKSAGSGGDDGGAADAGKSCASAADCDTGWVCGFPTADRCSAKGTCFDARGLATCAAYSPGCACDGSEINVACLPLPSGYTEKPLDRPGRCDYADAGTGGACTSTNDCAPGFMCGFPAADACMAKGTCFDTRDMAVCQAYSPGCACDGTEINITCLPLPSGYEEKPLRHTGKCVDGG